MIKCDKGFVQVSGEKCKILAEVAAIIHSLHSAFVQEEGISEDEAKADIMEAVELGLETDKHVKEMAEKAVGKLGELIHRAVDEVLKGKGDK